MAPPDPRPQQRQAIAAAAEQTWRRFCQFVANQLPPSALAGEGASAVVQSAVVRGLKQIEAGAVEASSVEQMERLLWCILRRRCVDRLRSPASRTFIATDPDALAEQAVAQAREPDLVALGQEFQAFFTRLDAADRDILLLDREGMGDAEIAPLVGLGSRDQVKRRRRRVLTALRLAYGVCSEDACPGRDLPDPLPARCPHCGAAYGPKDHALALRLRGR